MAPPTLLHLAPLLGAPLLGALLAWALVRFETAGRRAARRRLASAAWESFALRRRELRVSVDAAGDATLHGIARGQKWSLARRPWMGGTRLVLRASLRGLSRDRVERLSCDAAARIPGAAVTFERGELSLATTVEEWEVDDDLFDALRALLGDLGPREVHAVR